MTNQIHTPESIKTLILKADKLSDMAVEKALLVLFDRQTSSEQASSTTTQVNGRGFSAVDAEILSSFATQIQRKQSQGIKLGSCLTTKQMVLARGKVARYSRQLAEVANEKASSSYSSHKAEETKKAVENFEKAKMEARLEMEREALSREEKRKTSYYNGRRTVDIQKEKVETLEKELKGIGGVEYRMDVEEEKHSLKTYQADPEARDFRAARNRISDWLRK